MNKTILSIERVTIQKVPDGAVTTVNNARHATVSSSQQENSNGDLQLIIADRILPKQARYFTIKSSDSENSHVHRLWIHEKTETKSKL